MANTVPYRYRLAAVRKLHGWSQHDLSNVSGVRRTYISYIETGNALPTPEQLTALETALGIQFDDPAVVAAFAVLSGSTTPIKP